MRRRYQEGNIKKHRGVWIAQWWEHGHRRNRTIGRVSMRFRLQRPQKCDQCLLILHGQIQPEFVAFHGASLYAITHKACWHVIVTQAARVKHLLQSRERTIVQIAAAIPDALQRRNLVVARPLACFQR